ncbi:putative ribonuclease H-like domain-containing protein [Tanacetum coccineum]
MEIVSGKDYILLPFWTADPLFSYSSKDSPDAGFKPSGEEEKKDTKNPWNKDSEDNAVDENIVYGCADDPNMPKLEEIVYSDDDEDVGAEADMNNLDAFIPVSPIPTTRIDKDHPKRAIGTKWVLRNKKEERGIVIKNKARLVAQGYTQEEGIDYNKVFAPVAIIEAIRLFLAYASFKDFVVYQMDVNSAFLYGKIEEEVYVYQPPGFEDLDFPDRVNKVEKALYGLHQAPRAWYETLSTYLLDSEFQRGKIDKTLFIKRNKSDILLVQVYVDDIIFGSTRKEMCTEFEKIMHNKFQMSFMGELTFFLCLQVKQKEDGIFISQDKYVTEILKKFSFSDVKIASTPMETYKPLLKDVDGENVDEHLYRSMTGSLMYLTSSRPDIMFAVCACVRFQVNHKVSHLHAVKRIFRYLKGASLDRKSTTEGCKFLGCRLISWQCKKQTVVANFTTKAEYIAASNCCGQLQALVDGKKVIITETSVRRDLHLQDAEGTECLPIATIFEELTRMGAKTTAWNEFSSTMASAIICLGTNQKFNFSKYIFDNMVKNLEGVVKFLMYPRFVQVSMNKQVGDMSHHKRIFVTPSYTKKVFGNMKREGKGFSGRVTPLFQTMMVQAHEEMGEGSANPTDPHHTPTITRPSLSQPQRKQKSRKSKKKNIEVPQPSGCTDNVPDENVPTTSNDPLLSGKDRLKLSELMDLCTNLQKKVLDLEKAKTAQDSEIASLKKRVKKLETRNKLRTPRLKSLRKVGSARRLKSSNEASLGDQEDASKQGRKIADIDANAEVTLVDETQGRNDEEMFDTGTLDGEEVFAEYDVVEKEVSVADLVTTAGEVVTTASVKVSTTEVTIDSATTTTVDELTLDQTLIKIKAAKPKVRGFMIQEPSEFTTTTTITPAASKPSQEKGKAKMTEPEKPLKKKD